MRLYPGLLSTIIIHLLLGFSFACGNDTAIELVKKAKNAYRINLQYDSARMLFKQALLIYTENNQPDKQAEVLYNMSMTHYIQSNYAEALKLSLKAKNIAQKFGSSNTMLWLRYAIKSGLVKL